MTDERPTVLLTRSAEENERLASIFGEKGLSTVSVPGIVIADPAGWVAVDAAIADLAGFDGVLFTSKNAVGKLLGRMGSAHPGAREVLDTRLIAAVGEKTEEALLEAGVRVDIVPEVGSAENLLASLDDIDLAGKRFLFPKSSIARDVLPTELRNRGAHVEEVVVYRTVPPEAAALESVRNSLVDGTIGCVAFFSPSAVRNIVQLLGVRCLESPVIAVIGPTTAAAAGTMGIRVDLTSSAATAEALADAIARTLASGAQT